MPLIAHETRKILKISLVANVLEWYEFSIYIYLATLMGQLFSASPDSVTRLIETYILFSVSYLARPLGSFFYGYIGDRIGRSYSLKSSLITMAIPTALIGILPTYHQIGFLATICLLFLKFIQGFAAGGELPMSACYVFEAAKPSNRSFLCGTTQTGPSIGFLGGSLVATLLFNYFDNDILLKWAWRIPYLLSVPLTVWIFNLRKSIDQTEHLPSKAISTNTATLKEDRKQKIEFKLEILKYTFKQIQFKRVITLMFLVAFADVCYYSLMVWMPTYLNYFLQLPQNIAQIFNTIGIIFFILFCFLSGCLSNIMGYKRLIIFHMIVLMILTYPLFKGMQSASYTQLLSIQLLFFWLLSGIVTVLMEALAKSFSKEVRAFGMTTTHTLSATFFGSTTPLVCTYLTNKTGIMVFPAFYMIFFGLLALPIALQLKGE